jgi:hypothetical protein
MAASRCSIWVSGQSSVSSVAPRTRCSRASQPARADEPTESAWRAAPRRLNFCRRKRLRAQPPTRVGCASSTRAPSAQPPAAPGMLCALSQSPHPVSWTRTTSRYTARDTVRRFLSRTGRSRARSRSRSSECRTGSRSLSLGCSASRRAAGSALQLGNNRLRPEPSISPAPLPLMPPASCVRIMSPPIAT